MFDHRVMLAPTATELIVVPSCGESLGAASVQAVSETSIQIRSIVALALAAPANPMRAAVRTAPMVVNIEVRRRMVALIPHRRELRRHRMAVSYTTRQSVHT